MRNALFTLGLIVAIPLLILCLPIILPYFAIADRLERRRLAAMPCPSCGTPFGGAEVQRARCESSDKQQSKIRDIIARGGGPRTVAPPWFLICHACGAQAVYVPQNKKLYPKDAASAA